MRRHCCNSPDLCIEPPSSGTKPCARNIASMKAAVEDEAAKVASTSADSAPLASQNASWDSDLIEASVSENGPVQWSSHR